jgi:hypothetical protein
MGGKSYEFDPEHPGKRAFSRSALNEQKDRVARSDGRARTTGGGSGELSYGRRFAETGELYQAHRMERELEALARQDDTRPAFRPPRGAPIGALPVAAEAPRRDRIAELADEAQQNTRMIGESLRDIFRALARIARLPIEAALIASRRFRPAHG